jgi:hypothetical protein
VKLVNEIQRVENDRLGQRDGENSVHEHLRERAGIATDRVVIPRPVKPIPIPTPIAASPT